MAIAVGQQVDPSYLLQRSQWQPQGWAVVPGQLRVLRQLPVYSDGTPAVHVQVDGFEWTDANGFGIGNADDGMARLRQAIQQRGSDLYAYALLRRQVLNIDPFGIPLGQVWSYRIVLVHSQVQLVGWAVIILAVAFAAIIFIQYLTTGHSPAVADLRGFFGGLITDAGTAAGQAGAAVVSPLIWATAAAGAIALALAMAGKSAGVKTPAPRPLVGGSAKIKSRHAELGIGT